MSNTDKELELELASLLLPLLGHTMTTKDEVLYVISPEDVIEALAEWHKSKSESLLTEARIDELSKLQDFLKQAHLYDQDAAMKLRWHFDNRIAELKKGDTANE